MDEFVFTIYKTDVESMIEVLSYLNDCEDVKKWAEEFLNSMQTAIKEQGGYNE